MKNSLLILLYLVVLLTACGTDNDTNNYLSEEQDYYQFQRIDLAKYDLDAAIMIPDATAGIGASFKPQVNHVPADYKWEISIGRNFNLQIEDFGDNAYRYPEVRKKILENKAFKVSIVKEDNDQVLYKRILDNSYHVYAVKKVDDVYYELKSREEGDSKKIAEFIYRSVKSFKKNKMEFNREDVLKVLGNIIEPDLKKDIVSLNLIENLEVFNQKILLTVAISNPALHARKRMQEAIQFNLRRFFGESIEIEATVKGMAAEHKEKRRKILPEVKHIVAIASGKGGVGKSTITANIAGGLIKLGYSVGIVDADIYGPSMPTMFDVVGERPTMTEVDGKQLISPVMSNELKLLSIGFFTDQDNAVVWRGPMASKALTQMFTDAHWGELDFLLVDLPPGTGDIHLSLVQTVPLDGVVIVSTPQEVALADARRGVNMFKMDSLKIPVLGIVENMAWFTPAELPENKYFIFGRDGAKNLAEGLNVPFLGAIPLVQSVCEAGDAGRPAVFQENTPVSKAFDELVSKFVYELESLKKEKSLEV